MFKSKYDSVLLIVKSTGECMRRFLAAIMLPALLACGDLRQMSDLSLEASELQGRYKTPMALTVVRGSLIISVPGVDINKLRPAVAREYALDIAKFAYAHYRHPEGFEQVAVQFVAHTTNRRSSRRVTYALAGSWPVSELATMPPTAR